jgi:hypothetical protein
MWRARRKGFSIELSSQGDWSFGLEKSQDRGALGKNNQGRMEAYDHLSSD